MLAENGIPGEVVVADNASDDRSAELAARAGARVVREPPPRLRQRLPRRLRRRRGRYIVMADADLTYDFGEIPRFVEELENGADLVMGDRMDGIQPGAMPWLHRYIGNPILSGTLNLFFKTGVRDAHCGMRAFRRDRLPSYFLQRIADLDRQLRQRPAAAGPHLADSPAAHDDAQPFDALRNAADEAPDNHGDQLLLPAQTGQSTPGGGGHLHQLFLLGIGGLHLRPFLFGFAGAAGSGCAAGAGSSAMLGLRRSSIRRTQVPSKFLKIGVT